MTKLGRVIKHYSVEEKRYHVLQILKREISVFSYSKEIGVPNGTLYRWMDKFAENQGMTKKEKAKPDASSELERLKMENARLQVQLEDERMKRKAYQRMISIAEKTFNIPIEKKSGAKRSKK